MENLVPLFYDAATGILILAMVIVCARRGFVRTIVSLIGYFAALFGAAACANPVAEWIYQTFVRISVEKGIADKLNEARPQELSESLLQLIEKLPSFVFDAAGLDRMEMLETLNGLVQDGGEGVAAAIAAAVVAPLVILLLRVILFLALFSLFMFFVRRLVEVFSGMNALPLIGPINQIFGGVLGLGQAALILYVILLILNFIMVLTGGEVRITIQGTPVVLLGDSVLNRTALLKFFMNWNPIDWLLHLDFESLKSQI